MKTLFNLSIACPIVTVLISGGRGGLHGVMVGTGGLHGMLTGVGALHSLISLSRVCMSSFLACAAMSSLILLASNNFGTVVGVGEMVSKFSSWSAPKRLADVMTGEVLGVLIALIVIASLRLIFFLVRQFLA